MADRPIMDERWGKGEHYWQNYKPSVTRNRKVTEGGRTEQLDANLHFPKPKRHKTILIDDE